jgi:hypothetical protein
MHSLAMMVFARGVSGSGFQLSMLKRICDARKFVLCVDRAGSLLEEYVNLVLEQESAKDVVMLTGPPDCDVFCGICCRQLHTGPG